MADLRAVVLRSDLQRLGRFDEMRVRDRFLGVFQPDSTRVIMLGSEDIGLITVRPEGGTIWLEHFYLRPQNQGRGVGGEVLSSILEELHGSPQTVRLNVLQGSAARRLYERLGFAVESEDPVDVFMRYTGE